MMSNDGVMMLMMIMTMIMMMVIGRMKMTVMMNVDDNNER